MENQNCANSDITTWALPDSAIARLGRGRVKTLALSPDGNTLAVGSGIGLWLYQVSTMEPFALWDTERGLVSAVTFSPKGDLLATGNSDGGVSVWDVQSQQRVAKMERTRKHANNVSRLAFSPDGHRLACSGGRYDTIYVWHSETGEQFAEFTVDNAPKKGPLPRIPLAFSLDGNLLASATPENTFSVWNLSTGKRIACLTGHPAGVTTLLFSPCGKFLISRDKEGTLRKWNVNRLTDIGKPSTVSSTTGWTKLAYSSKGTLLASEVIGTTLTVWDMERNEKLARLEHKELRELSHATHFSETTDSQVAIAGPRTIQVWNLGDSAPHEAVIRGHTYVCGCVKFSPDGKKLAAGYWIGDIIFWDVRRREPQVIFAEEPMTIRSISFSPCGNKLAASSYDATVRVWDVEKPDAPIAKLIGHQQKSIYAVAFSPTEERLVSADADGVLIEWDLQNGTARRTLTGISDWIWHIAFSPDGKCLAVASHRTKAFLWDVENWRLITELPTHRPQDSAKYKGDAYRIQEQLKWRAEGRIEPPVPKTIAFSPCGNVIAGGLFRTIRLWDAKTAETRMVICLPQGCQRAAALTFSPCGRYLVSGASWQGTDKMSIRLWEVATGENISTFWGHATDIQSLAFSPDGTLLASGSYDGTILLWDMAPFLNKFDIAPNLRYH